MAGSLKTAVDVFTLTPQNCTMYETPEKIFCCRVPEKGYDGRAFPAKAFPFEKEETYLSLMDEEKEEIGMIPDLSVFPEDQAALLRRELKKRYFMPRITRILKIEDRFSTSYWQVETELGDLDFSMKDTQKNIIRVTETRLILVDSDGCRYEIADHTALDRKSRSKLQLYL